MPHILIISIALLFFSCQEEHKKEIANITVDTKDTVPPRPPREKRSTGKGSLSFKMNGQLYKADPTRTKCWSTTNIPLAMLLAKGEGFSVSWQMGYTKEQSEYKLDGDKKGTINFTIGGKTYWTKSVLGDNYLNIKFTGIKDKYSIILLSGTFEGVLEDKDGNKVQITEGRFETEDI